MRSLLQRISTTHPKHPSTEQPQNTWKTLCTCAGSFLGALTLATTAAFSTGTLHIPVQFTDAALTDTLTFNNAYQATEKPVFIDSQWAYALDDLSRGGANTDPQLLPSVGSTLTSPSNRTPQPAQNSTNSDPSNETRINICVWGGSGTGCNNLPAAAAGEHTADANTYRTFIPIAADSAELFDPGAIYPSGYVATDRAIRTFASCKKDGTLVGEQPQGVIRFGGSTNRFQWALDLSTLANGVTKHDGANLTSGDTTRIEYDATASWGTDPVEKRAWSEIKIVFVAAWKDGNGFHKGDSRNNWSGPEYTLTAKSECGFGTNDNGGSYGKRDSNTAGTQALFAPLTNLMSNLAVRPKDGATQDSNNAVDDALPEETAAMPIGTSAPLVPGAPKATSTPNAPGGSNAPSDPKAPGDPRTRGTVTDTTSPAAAEPAPTTTAHPAAPTSTAPAAPRAAATGATITTSEPLRAGRPNAG